MWVKGEDFPKVCPSAECQSPDWEFKPLKFRHKDLVLGTIERDIKGEIRYFPTEVLAPLTYKDLAKLAIFIAEND